MTAAPTPPAEPEPTLRYVTYFDPDFGAVAAVVDESGEIVATSSSSIRDSIYTAVDEAACFEATGELPPLLPAALWDRARDGRP